MSKNPKDARKPTKKVAKKAKERRAAKPEAAPAARGPEAQKPYEPNFALTAAADGCVSVPLGVSAKLLVLRTRSNTLVDLVESILNAVAPTRESTRLEMSTIHERLREDVVGLGFGSPKATLEVDFETSTMRVVEPEDQGG